MSENALKDNFRKRIEFEDELFNSRTTIFLGTNGLWAAAAGISGDFHLQIGIGILGILVTMMWLMCSWQSQRVIKELTVEYLKLLKSSNDPENRVEKTVQKALWSPRLRPTNILAQWLPVLFLFVWTVFLVWLIWSSL
jgi:hypothetical protein